MTVIKMLNIMLKMHFLHILESNQIINFLYLNYVKYIILFIQTAIYESV